MALNTYRVTGGRRVLEHNPGDTFKADLSPSQERSLIASGHLEKIPPKRAERALIVTLESKEGS